MICFTGRCLLHTARRQGAHTSTHRHPVHTHRHPVHTLPAHTHSPYSLYTGTAGINTRKKEYIVYITCQAELRQKSRQIKTYLVVIYGNAYTPCWPAAPAAQLSFVSFHLSPQFASVCLHCCTPICLPFASLSFFALSPPSFPCPTSLPYSASTLCLCMCVLLVLFLYTRLVPRNIRIRRNQKKFRQFRNYFSRDTFQFFLKFFSSYFPFCTFLY